MAELFIIAHSSAQIDDCPGTFSTSEIMEMTGISSRRINYWLTSGVFGEYRPQGSGSRVRWKKNVIPVIGVLLELSEELGGVNGGNTILMRQVVHNFDRGWVRIGNKVRLTWRDDIPTHQPGGPREPTRTGSPSGSASAANGSGRAARWLHTHYTKAIRAFQRSERKAT